MPSPDPQPPPPNPNQPDVIQNALAIATLRAELRALTSAHRNLEIRHTTDLASALLVLAEVRKQGVRNTVILAAVVTAVNSLSTMFNLHLIPLP